MKGYSNILIFIRFFSVNCKVEEIVRSILLNLFLSSPVSECVSSELM